MRFEINPQLILSKDEFETLDNALKLCRDMDAMTSGDNTCSDCPFYEKCSRRAVDCVYIKASDALKAIIDIAVVK